MRPQRDLHNPHDEAARRFRPDIEGLRAISILAVVLYHAKVPGFSGGFVGVDVFFVISGFLICRLLLDEVAATGRVNLWRFWSRRARRLLPNAMLTLATILLICIFLMPGFVRGILAREVISVALYVANYRFATEAIDYFSFDDPPSPAMHFWSLSVEEQFYVAWPLMLLAASLMLRNRPVIATITSLLGTIWIASFVASIVLIRDNQPLAFFHTETRAWQLATGGLLAVYANAGRAPLAALIPSLAMPMSAAFGWLGLAAIASSVALFDDTLLYPGYWALIPTIGAAAVVGAGLDGGALAAHGRFLRLAVLRWIGARSYSWYLWHWPLVVFAQTMFPTQPFAALASVPVSLALASLVYSRFEDPIRRGRILAAPPSRTLVAAAASIVLLVAGASAFALVPQLGGTASASLIERLKTARADHGRNYDDNCHLDYDDTAVPECAYGVPSAAHRAVIFGDSHAAQWFAALDAAASAEGWEFKTWTKSSCPSVDVAIWYIPRRAPYVPCDTWRGNVLRALTGPQRPDVVFLSNLTDYSRWIRDRTTGAILPRSDADTAWRNGFRDVLKVLTHAGVAVVVIRDTPRAFKSFASCLAQGGGAACDRPRSQALGQPSPDMDVAREFGKRVTILDLSDRICDAEMCPTTRDGMVLYLDSEHLTATFAATLSPDFRTILARFAKHPAVAD